MEKKTEGLLEKMKKKLMHGRMDSTQQPKVPMKKTKKPRYVEYTHTYPCIYCIL